jgi:CRP-like cAMP-binding protein
MAWHNHFLDSLPAAEAEILAPDLKRVAMGRDTPLAEPYAPVNQVLLPINCVVSVLSVMQDGRTVESRTIGCESGFGLLNAIGSRFSFERVVIQISGDAWRAPIDALAEAARRSPTIVRHIVRHAQATLVQSAQSTACNSLHTVEQRLARWLLLTKERVSGEVLMLTQEHLSVMLGVQRTTVTAVASEMQSRGWISYSRGRIEIRDHAALLAASCECYEAIEAAAARMLDDRDRATMTA